MSLLARQQDFEPANPTEGASALYYDKTTGGGYLRIMTDTFFVRIDALKGRIAPNNQKTAIWGCGWGYLVNLAVAAGYDAYGFDASSYAINKAKALFPNIANRFFLRNALVSADVSGSRGDAGLQGNQRFPILMTEDLLDVMTDAEIATALPLLRNASSGNLAHIITLPHLPPFDSRVNWKTVAEWKALLSPPDIVLNADGSVL